MKYGIGLTNIGAPELAKLNLKLEADGDVFTLDTELSYAELVEKLETLPEYVILADDLNNDEVLAIRVRSDDLSVLDIVKSDFNLDTLTCPIIAISKV